MKRNDVENHVASIIAAIDTGMRLGLIPATAMTYSDVSRHLTEPPGDLASLTELERDHVITRVDEILRIRAGGVD